MSVTHSSIQTTIIHILESHGTEASLKKTKDIAESKQDMHSLHLRDLGLTQAKILAIAVALQSSNVPIGSVSLGYNQAMKDAGAVALIEALPDSVFELGLVACGIGDEGGKKLLQWMQENTTNLQMICIENNDFSDNLKMHFKNFRLQNPKIIFIF